MGQRLVEAAAKGSRARVAQVCSGSAKARQGAALDASAECRLQCHKTQCCPMSAW